MLMNLITLIKEEFTTKTFVNCDYENRRVNGDNNARCSSSDFIFDI